LLPLAQAFLKLFRFSKKSCNKKKLFLKFEFASLFAFTLLQHNLNFSFFLFSFVLAFLGAIVIFHGKSLEKSLSTEVPRKMSRKIVIRGKKMLRKIGPLLFLF
jgi:hypothetical protein